eukprot:Protomagalhaensia_wolfi_Nauph_80__4822@NODE_5035_length_457_cov_26_550239_g4100_i0_p1_GENE_NODE_5035_length_457_cov_26_550239_g4100_i0NODE_5035_length_457_cov_26_550239_g4100_i0_p1_ORF_typecomplete_len100_score3_73Sugar_tr/PF00083_24/3_1e11Spore_permease/PF03845_13/0_0064MFS_1/PF07690_16/0_029NicO/PF03824_16/0_082CHD5/PF04420_14/0_22_NODE_5035_length_457_cov_26_550239_g4100_i0141440
MAFFSLSAGPVTWLYIFEIFPMDIKATASSICVAVNWIGGIIMVFMAGLLPFKYAFTTLLFLSSQWFALCHLLLLVYLGNERTADGRFPLRAGTRGTLN